MERKYLIPVLVLCTILGLALTACNGKPNANTDPVDVSGDNTGPEAEGEQTIDPVIITDVDFGGAQSHEELVALEFADGEAVDSVFYKRTTDPETNAAAYMVKVVNSNGEEIQYLPMDKTVCYVDEALVGRAYYERVPLSYVADGVPVETYQYQIYTSTYGISPVAEAAPAE